MKLTGGRRVWGLAAVLATLGALTAGAADFSWIGTSGGSWATAGNWTPSGGPPGAGDNATLINNGGWVNIVNDAAYSLTFGGTLGWVLSPAGNTLTIGAGGLLYQSTGSSEIRPILAGASMGNLTVDAGAGQLMLRGANTFVANINVLSGRLYALGNDNQGNGNLLGNAANTVYLGKLTPGADDATLILAQAHSGATYPQPVVVRAGNSGLATIAASDARNYGLTMSGGVTFNKDIVLLNDELTAMWYYGGIWLSFDIANTFTGAGTVTKLGRSMATITAPTHYTGATVVRDGWLSLHNATSTTTGNYTVVHGALYMKADSSLGHPANTITLGGPGTFGGLGAWDPVADGVVVTPRPVTLAGNGGFLLGRFNDGLAVSNTIAGPGRLIAAVGNTTFLDGNNTYTGGTHVVDTDWSELSVQNRANDNNTIFGKGDVWVKYRATVGVRGPANVDSNAKVRLTRHGSDGADLRGILRVYGDFMPPLDAASEGVIVLMTNSGPNLNAYLAGTSLGNQYLAGGVGGNGYTCTVSSLAAGAGNLWRLGGYNNLALTLDYNGSASYVGALTGNNGLVVGRRLALNGEGSLDGRGNVILRDANTFTGDITVNPQSTLTGYTISSNQVPGGSPFGHASGGIRLIAANLAYIGNNDGGQRQGIAKGTLHFQGDCHIYLNNNYMVTELTLAGTNRIERGTLNIRADPTFLGTNSPTRAERLIVAGGIAKPDAGVDMVSPVFAHYESGNFLTYDAVTGFKIAPFTATALSTAEVTSVVNLAAAEAVPTGGKTIYAIKTGRNITGSDPLTIVSGGLSGDPYVGNPTISAPLIFTREPVIWAWANITLSGTITSSEGLTKSGYGWLYLNANNAGQLSGPIVVNGGRLRVQDQNSVGGSGNPLWFNGGTLKIVANSVTLANPIYIGEGGMRWEGEGSGPVLTGVISGPGSLSLFNLLSGFTINGSVPNTYEGGTLISSYATLTVGPNTSLGTGPVILGSPAGGTGGSNPNKLVLQGNNNVPGALINSTWGNVVEIRSSYPVIGSIEGMGQIQLSGDVSPRPTLRVGGNGRSTDFYGRILDQYKNSGGRLVKEGAGTLTLWGECTYSGGTIVSNGTLLVNGYLYTNAYVEVRPSGTLGGIGTVGFVTNSGGVVSAGGLYVRSLTLTNAATLSVRIDGPVPEQQYDRLNIIESLNVAPDTTLNLQLGAVPTIGDTYLIINNLGSGTIAPFSAGRIVSATYGGRTYYFGINYTGGDGNDVVLTALPAGTIISIR